MRIYLETSGRKNPLGTGRVIVRKGITFYYRHFARGNVQKVNDAVFDFGILLLTKSIK